MCLQLKHVNSSGIEGNPTVFYRLMPGSTAQTNKQHTFYLQQRPDNGDTWADIKVNHPLDYESIKEYNLTIRVEVSHILTNLLESLSHLIYLRFKAKPTSNKQKFSRFGQITSIFDETYHRMDWVNSKQLITNWNDFGESKFHLIGILFSPDKY